VISAATGAGTASRTIEKQPDSLELERASTSLARGFVRLALRFEASRASSRTAAVRPTWPITGIPASTIARARETDGPAPSSFTTSARASFTNRIALRTASSSETWYEPNGMSPTTIGR
jgi:hypothetical protein